MKRFCRKGLSVCLILGLLLAFCPMAMAVEKEGSIGVENLVDSQAITAGANLYFVRGDANTYLVKNGIKTDETLDGLVRYDAVKNNLILSNFAKDEIQLIAENMGEDFTISLTGDSRTNHYQPFLWVKGNATIKGDGSLKVYSGDGKVVPSMRIEGNLTVNNGNLDLEGLGGGIICYGDIIINGGKTVGRGGVDGNPGIRCASLTVNGGSLQSSGSQGAVYVENSIIVNGGTLITNSNPGNGALQQYVTGAYQQIVSHENLANANLTINDKMSISAGNVEPIGAVSAYNGEAHVKITGPDVVPTPVEPETPVAEPDGSILYRTHVQNEGWQGFVADGTMSGTSGKSLRLEGIEIKSNLEGVGIQYKTHVQNIGWQEFVADGTMSGTSGKGLRLEAIQIKLTGENADSYDVYYRVHAQNLGWLGWAKDGENAGSSGLSYRLEGIEIQILPAGTTPEGSDSDTNAFVEGIKVTFLNFRWKTYQTVYIAKGNKVSQPVDPIKDNHIFAGWYADAAHTIPWDFDNTIEKNMNLWSDWSYTGVGEDPEWNVPDADSTGSDGGAIFGDE